MAMIKCTECGSELSDKAKACPHCGIPMKEIQKILNPPKEEVQEEKKEEISYMASAVPAEEKKKKRSIGFVFLLLSAVCAAGYLGFTVSYQVNQAGLLDQLKGFSVPVFLEGIKSYNALSLLELHLGLMAIAVLIGLIGMSASNRFFVFLSLICYVGAGAAGWMDQSYVYVIPSGVLTFLGLIFLWSEIRKDKQ